MQIEKFLQDATTKYSFHFIAWMFPLLLAITLFVLYLLWLFFANKIDIGTGQTITWFAIIFIPPVVMPSVILEYILIFCIIQHYETTNSEFRFKDSFFNTNTLLKLIFVLLLIAGILLYLFLVCYTTGTIFVSDIYRHFFFVIGIPVMISVLPINLFLYKILHNTVLHQK